MKQKLNILLDWKEKSFAYIVSDSARYRARYYAAWIVRFVSVDSLQYKYQYYMSCQYAGNKSITYIDLDGLEEDNPANRYSLQCNNFSDKNAPQQDTFFLALDISNVLSLCLLGSEELLMSENKSQNQVNRTVYDAISTCTKSVGEVVGTGIGRTIWNPKQIKARLMQEMSYQD